MPSFSEETIEKWRQQRIDNGDFYSHEGLQKDIEEEVRRLAEALAQVELSESNIEKMKKATVKVRTWK